MELTFLSVIAMADRRRPTEEDWFVQQTPQQKAFWEQDAEKVRRAKERMGEIKQVSAQIMGAPENPTAHRSMTHEELLQAEANIVPATRALFKPSHQVRQEEQWRREEQVRHEERQRLQQIENGLPLEEADYHDPLYGMDAAEDNTDEPDNFEWEFSSEDSPSPAEMLQQSIRDNQAQQPTPAELQDLTQQADLAQAWGQSHPGAPADIGSVDTGSDLGTTGEAVDGE